MKNALQEAMKKHDRRAVETPAPEPETVRKSQIAPSRVGKRRIGAYVSADAHRLWKRMAADRDSNVEAMLIEAINDYCAKHGMPTLA